MSSPGATWSSTLRLLLACAASRPSSLLMASAMERALLKSASCRRMEKLLRPVRSSGTPRSTDPPSGTRAVVGWFMDMVLPLAETE